MTGMPHTIETLKLRTGQPRMLRRALELVGEVGSALTAQRVILPSQAIVHCHLCGSSYRARANHFCPKLYGR